MHQDGGMNGQIIYWHTHLAGRGKYMQSCSDKYIQGVQKHFFPFDELQQMIRLSLVVEECAVFQPVLSLHCSFLLSCSLLSIHPQLSVFIRKTLFISLEHIYELNCFLPDLDKLHFKAVAWEFAGTCKKIVLGRMLLK